MYERFVWIEKMAKEDDDMKKKRRLQQQVLVIMLAFYVPLFLAAFRLYTDCVQQDHT